MEDLGLIAELFKTSSTLVRAAASLEKLGNRKGEFDPSEKEALSWSGKFLLAMDWNAQKPSDPPVSGGLALQATSVRPTFYSCLFRMAPQIRSAGMQSEKELISFLINLYKYLISPGMPSKGSKELSSENSKLGASLLREIAESILVQINNNGLPRPFTTLKDEWKPTANELTPFLAF
jgi:hypothetical protein